jgi:hypothetical protein
MNRADYQQAEAADLAGAASIESTEEGFREAGYVRLSAPDGALTLKPYENQNLPFTQVHLRVSNGTRHSQYVLVEASYVPRSVVRIPPTGGWDKWVDITMTLSARDHKRGDIVLRSVRNSTILIDEVRLKPVPFR